MGKKLSPLLFTLVIVSLACSLSDITNLVQATPTLPPTATPAPPTITPSPVIFPTHTFTPTFIALPSEAASTATPPSTPTPAETATATAVIPSLTATASLAGLSGTGFNAVNVSAAVFYWGSCQPTTSTLTVTVANPAQVADVVLFTRIDDKTTGGQTPWDKGNSMAMVGPGVFSRTLNGPHMGVSEDSWILYQFVGTDSRGQVVARSPVFHDTLSLSPCP